MQRTLVRRPLVRRPLVLLLAIGGLLGLVSAPAEAAAGAAAGAAAVQVRGEVTAPVSYTPGDLLRLPQVTRGNVTGVSLEALVVAGAPVLPDVKNAALRVSVTVTGSASRAVTLALGELDPAFGDHDALLVVRHGRVAMVVPGDRAGLRTVRGVRTVDVAVADAPPSVVAPGDLVVHSGRHTRVLTARQLAQLPTTTRTVTFSAGTAPQEHVETGPSLLLVLLRAGVVPDLTTGVAAVGADGYAAVVTPGESLVGGRPLLVSTVEDGVPLTRPRLVVDGDLKGGRYVSDLTDLVVSRA